MAWHKGAMVSYIRIDEKNFANLKSWVDSYEVIYTDSSYSVLVHIDGHKRQAYKGDYLARRGDGVVFVLKHEEFQRLFI